MMTQHLGWAYCVPKEQAERRGLRLKWREGDPTLSLLNDSGGRTLTERFSNRLRLASAASRRQTVTVQVPDAS